MGVRHIALAVVIVVVLVVAVVGMSFAGSYGMLPWQPEPTRIPITPFADLGDSVSTATP